MSKNKTKVQKLSFCAIMASTIIVLMLGSIIPGLIYIMPGICGMMIWVISDVISMKWAFLTYAVTGILMIFLVPNVEAVAFYIGLLGFYPIFREKFLVFKSKLINLLIKILIFNVLVLIVVNSLEFLMGIAVLDDEFGTFGEYAKYILLAISNIAFFLYDSLLSNMKILYKRLIKPRFKGRLG